LAWQPLFKKGYHIYAKERQLIHIFTVSTKKEKEAKIKKAAAVTLRQTRERTHNIP